MKHFIKNIILLVFLLVLAAAIILPLAAEMSLNRAGKLEANYCWKKAGEKYQAALHLNPLNAEYFAAAGDFLTRQSTYRQDKLSWLKRAKRLYEYAGWLNPGYAEYWYSLGRTELAHSSLLPPSPRLRKTSIAEAIENFRKAIELEPYDFRLNYLIGDSLLRAWKFLDTDEKDFCAARLKYVLAVKPWFGRYIYPLIIYYIDDFSFAEKVTPDNLEGSKNLLAFVKWSGLNGYRREAAERMDFYRKKETGRDE